MDRNQLIKAIEGDYTVIFSLDGSRSVQTDTAKQYFDRKKYYNIGSTIKIPHHNYDCSIVDMFMSEKNKTIFIAVKEICNCSEIYNCCDCGGNDCGCGYCWSCNACEDCLNEE